MARGRAPQRRPPATHLPNGSRVRMLTADDVFLVVAYCAGLQPLSTRALAERVEAAYPDWVQDRTRLHALLESLARDNRVTKTTNTADTEGHRAASLWQLAPGTVHPPTGTQENT